MEGEVVHCPEAANQQSAPAIYRSLTSSERLYQGEIVERVIEWIAKYDDARTDAVAGTEPRQHGLAIVLTQDCDLAQDWAKRAPNLRATSDLPCILLCPAWPAEVLRESQKLSSDLWKPVRANKNERFQYLAEVPKELDTTGEGHAALVVDFKSVFTVRTIEIYRQLRVGGTNTPRRRFRLDTPWAEHLQCRYAAYQARVGLPRDHFTPEKRRSEAAPG